MRHTANTGWTVIDVNAAVGVEVAGDDVGVDRKPCAVGCALADLQALIGIGDAADEAQRLANAGAGNVAQLRTKQVDVVLRHKLFLRWLINVTSTAAEIWNPARRSTANEVIANAMTPAEGLTCM